MQTDKLQASRNAVRRAGRSAIVKWLFITLPGLAFGQDQVKVVSVCEVLANLNEYGNSVVAVVGRLDVQGVIYDRHSYVSQDGCESPVITDSYVWPNKILVWTMREKGLPNPPTDRPELDRQLLVEKLESVRRKTILGLRREFRVNKNGELVDITIQNQWVVAYGHTFYVSIYRVESLHSRCLASGSNG